MTSPRPGVQTPPQPVAVIGFSGELDLASAPVLARLRRAVRIQPCPHLLVDLTNVTFIDSFALDEFARAQRRATASGGSVAFHGVAGPVREIFLATEAGRRLLDPDGTEPGSGPEPAPPDAA
jgi:anti-anti-sigma factor